METSEPVPETLAQRMKRIEASFTHSILPDQAIVVRLDGHCFSNLTRSLPKPFDPRFSECMIRVATELLKRWHPATAYTHSDEITLIFPPNATVGYTHPFNGRVNKICSILASECGIFFCKFAQQLSMPDLIWAFDARVLAFGGHELHEVANHMIFRQRDCKRNAVSTMARAKFGPKAILNKNTTELVAMLQMDPDLLSADMCGTFIKKIQPPAPKVSSINRDGGVCPPDVQIVARRMLVTPKGQDILLCKYWPD